MLVRAMAPVAAISRSGTKLRSTPTTAVRPDSMNQCPMSMTGAPYPSSEATWIRPLVTRSWLRSGDRGLSHWEFCS